MVISSSPISQRAVEQNIEKKKFNLELPNVLNNQYRYRRHDNGIGRNKPYVSSIYGQSNTINTTSRNIIQAGINRLSRRQEGPHRRSVALEDENLQPTEIRNTIIYTHKNGENGDSAQKIKHQIKMIEEISLEHGCVSKFDIAVVKGETDSLDNEKRSMASSCTRTHQPSKNNTELSAHQSI